SCVRTVYPDGSEQRQVYGVPASLDHPERFEPTPWECYTYDPNDNAGRTHAASAAVYQSHWNTPTSVRMDALGRTVETVARAGPVAQDRLVTRQEFDVEGNVLTVVDQLGRTVVSQVYDLAGRPLRTEHLDSGVFLTVIDAEG